MTIHEGAELDITSAEYAADPYWHYRKLREQAAAHWIGPAGSDRWVLVTRCELGRQVLADGRFSKHLPGKYTATSTAGGEGRSMLGSDPPAHTRLRATVSSTFSGRAIAARRPRIARISEELVDAMVARLDPPGAGVAELRHEYALPFAFTVLSEIIGIPDDRRDDFHAWTVRMLSPAPTEAERTAQATAVDNIRAYVRERVAVEARERGTVDDTAPLLRALAIDASENALTDGEIVTMITLILAAGYEGAANMILNGMAAFLVHEDQWKLLTSTPSMADAAVREALRYDCPVQRATLRVATEDVRFGDVTFEAGTLVGVSLAAANHDPEAFADAEAFDIGRPPAPNMAFSHGIHRCLGASLATTEGAVAFRHLATRLPDLRLHPAAGPIRWCRTGFLRGPEEIRVVRGDAG
ncbi:cytochrome P450 [Asanoa ferruginea]|uniref:Cytochrome P450 n=1 Tax=Asanoa ferruginea TaxID=53367 RepID=A0A3D9ZPS9_9ACTN|nr:cytochrome P450 [Asanoa ferruginea]REF98879.1 cytochrome P450 [Asanoa ferruginea]GIF46439.1 cytochrome P450 hydroxylase [Asanoa ferruginea]